MNSYFNNHYMNSPVIFITVILVVIIIIIYIIYKNINTKTNKSNEYYTNNDYGFACNQDECYVKGMTDCLKCTNCSYIADNFQSKCVPSDHNGNPLDKKIKYTRKYSNDPWTRALITVNENYDDMNIPVMN